MSRLRALRRDERGAAIIEFAIVAPVLCLLVVGGLDLGHSLYMRSNVQGLVQRVGRDSGLETGTLAARQAALDARVRQEVLRLHNGANVQFSRINFTNFTQAQRRHEPFTDSGTPGDKVCNNGEPYTDENGNGRWDANLGRTGQGSAKDAVVYTVNISYDSLLPMWQLLGWPNNDYTVEASTVLRNQPYGEQTSRVQSTVRNCTP